MPVQGTPFTKSSTGDTISWQGGTFATTAGDSNCFSTSNCLEEANGTTPTTDAMSSENLREAHDRRPPRVHAPPRARHTRSDDDRPHRLLGDPVHSGQTLVAHRSRDAVRRDLLVQAEGWCPRARWPELPGRPPGFGSDALGVASKGSAFGSGGGGGAGAVVGPQPSDPKAPEPGADSEAPPRAGSGWRLEPQGPVSGSRAQKTGPLVAPGLEIAYPADMRSIRILFAAALALALLPCHSTAASLPSDATLAQWVDGMKTAPRGPFERLGWFCNDGSVRGARAGCEGHGGGIQHGVWNERAKTMRSNDIYVANVIAELDPKDFTGPNADLAQLRQILLERFLMEFDDGWVLRATRTYRGALQAEDEEVGASKVILAMMADPQWTDDSRYYLLRETVRALPREMRPGQVTSSEVRSEALRIANLDRGFMPLRIKIHGVPDAGDAQRVREYASTKGKSSLAADYEGLATMIDQLYQGRAAAQDVMELAEMLPQGKLRSSFEYDANILAKTKDPQQHLRIASKLATRVRLNQASWSTPEARRQAFETSLALEDEIYVAGNQLIARMPSATRAERLEWLKNAIGGLYATGLISKTQAAGLQRSRGKILDDPDMDVYREEVAYLGRGPEWAVAQAGLQLNDAVDRFQRFEPKAMVYSQDRLRGSPFLFYGAVVDSLQRDANYLSGVRSELFGESVGSGLRALNPGLARGVLRVPHTLHDTRGFQKDGIYLLPQTIAELPPVSGILTEGEGSSLSHVQLLARNLGIPNVVVSRELVPKVKEFEGASVVLAVSPGGVVQLAPDGPRWAQIFSNTGGGLRIKPDLDKLDLAHTSFVPLDDLRARDSGRLAGPKSANLGELRHHYDDQVPNGFAIPFGAFRKLLDKPIKAGGPSVFEWMKQGYDRIARLEGPSQEKAVQAFLRELRTWIENVDPGPEFRAELHTMLESTFGPNGTYGVFVRSDTNVEDLEGFTGAGLNLTVPNVVGEKNILKAIKEVWASPFTERAYSWRQAHMDDPEYVFPAVLIQLAFPSDKSGVMVTKDVDSGREGYLSVAVNEGVGGAVDGQSAESLLIDANSGNVRLLAQATAPKRRELVPSGGLREVPTTNKPDLLSKAEVAQLIKLAKDAPSRFSTLRDSDGNDLPADIEFAFKDGRLELLQIRPFVESKGAQNSAYLKQLDEGLKSRSSGDVKLDQVPASG